VCISVLLTASAALAEQYTSAQISNWLKHAESLKAKCVQAVQEGKRCPELKYLHDSVGIGESTIGLIDDKSRLVHENEVLKAQLGGKPYSSVRNPASLGECNYQSIRDEKMLGMGFPEAGNEEVIKGPSAINDHYCWKRSKTGSEAIFCENKNALNILFIQNTGKRKRERREDYLFSERKGKPCSLQAVSVEQKVDGKAISSEKALVSECARLFARMSSGFAYVPSVEDRSGRAPASAELHQATVCLKYGVIPTPPAPTSSPAHKEGASVTK